MKYLFTIITVVLLTIGHQANAQINRVEPPNWWVGMNNNSLELMVYGDEISSYDVAVEYPGVSVEKVTKVESPNYLFINLIINKNTKPGDFPIVFTKGRKSLTHKYTLKARETGSAERTSFDNSDVIYLLMPDRFANGDTANDSTNDTAEKADRTNQGGRHGGDIQGIIDRLDYLNNMGVTAIWSTPLLEDNEPVFSYHTYACSDYYNIDSRYGTNDLYRTLRDEMHKRDMKLIMDMVPNHCGTAHWWMKDLPMQSWIHQFDEFTRSNFRMATWHDPYASEKDKFLNQNGWFDTSMPDLDQENELLLTYLKQNAVWWVEFAGLDGIRVDTYPYNNKWKAAEWISYIRNEYPNLNIVGECWQHRPSEIAYWQSGVKNPDGFDSQLPAVMDFCLTDQMAEAFNEDEQGWDKGVGRFYLNFVTDHLYADPMNLLIFTSNHDTQRFATLVNNDVDKYKLAYTFLFTTRGIPQVYYGFEIMMGGDKGKGDGDIRRDFPGGWPNDSRDAFTAEGRTNQENQVFNHISKLLNWRKKNPVVQTGKMRHFIPEDNVYVYFRYNDQKKVMVVLNNKPSEKTIQTGRFSEMLQGVSSATDIITGKTYSDIQELTIPAKAGLVLELK
ncbi:alpha-amlyase [Puteibacter caeruleilacunae]|nr:alpha-amlyase [Puteibacter caeruleilacunae]